MYQKHHVHLFALPPNLRVLPSLCVVMVQAALPSTRSIAATSCERQKTRLRSRCLRSVGPGAALLERWYSDGCQVVFR
jgi:hypothetical protein